MIPHLDGTVFYRVRQGNRARIAVRCGCGAQDSVGCKPTMPPPALANVFRRRGWEIAKRHDGATCPQCQKKGDKDVAKKVPDATPNAVKAQRKLFALLDEHYDTERFAYQGEHSDETIAAETGLSVDYVAVIREKGYVPLVDPRLSGLRKQAGQIARDLAALPQTIEEMVRNEQASLEARPDEMEIWKRPDGIVVTSYDCEVVRQWALGLMTVLQQDPDCPGLLLGFISGVATDTDVEMARECLARGREQLKAQGEPPAQCEPDTELRDRWVAEGRRQGREAGWNACLEHLRAVLQVVDPDVGDEWCVSDVAEMVREHIEEAEEHGMARGRRQAEAETVAAIAAMARRWARASQMGPARRLRDFADAIERGDYKTTEEGRR